MTLPMGLKARVVMCCKNVCLCLCAHYLLLSTFLGWTVTIRTELSLEFSNSPNIQAVRLPLKFKYILTIPHMCDQLRQTVKAP